MEMGMVHRLQDMQNHNADMEKLMPLRMCWLWEFTGAHTLSPNTFVALDLQLYQRDKWQPLSSADTTPVQVMRTA